MQDLIEAARSARAAAYAPYSGLSVGAAIETATGDVFTGSNVENSNYSNSIHAEELALASAVSSTHREFSRLVVVSDTAATPCGRCRQTLSEFDDSSLEVHVTDGETVREFTLVELLPHAFESSMLSPDKEGDGPGE